MTDSLDPRTGPLPEDETAEDRAATDPDALSFFGDEPASGVSTGIEGLEGDATGAEPGPNAGYIGGLAEGNSGAVGMRQVMADEAVEARGEGDVREPDANLGQQDR
jgi:hypothetical protein